MGGNYSSTHS